MVKGKGINPSVAKRLTVLEILKLFSERKTRSWRELWQDAKSKKIPYPTLKRTVNNLIKNGLIRVETKEDFANVKLTLLLDSYPAHILNEIISILEKRFEEFVSEPPHLPPAFFKFNIFTNIQSEYLNKFLGPEEFVKMSSADRAIRETLYKVLENIALSHSPDAKERLQLFKGKMQELVDRIYTPLVLKAEIPDARERKRWLDFVEEINKRGKVIAFELIFMSPDINQAVETFFKISPRRKNEIRPLIEWLAKNSKVREEYARESEKYSGIVFVTSILKAGQKDRELTDLLEGKKRYSK